MNSERGTFMRRLLITLFCLAALSMPVFAQTDDHNDAGPLLVGYAVVTATKGIIPFGFGGLTAFETFGYRSQTPALQAVLPATLTTRIVLFASSSIRLSDNVGVAITNPGSGNAVVTMTLRDTNGNLTSTKIITIAAGQQVSRFVSEFFADVAAAVGNFDGTMTLTSNTPVAVLALRFLGTTFSSIPLTSLSTPLYLPDLAPGSISLATNSVLLPQFASNDQWATEMVLVNAGPRPLTVRIDLFKQDGTPLVATLNHQPGSSFPNLTIAAGGV